jgi:MFS family permease
VRRLSLLVGAIVLVDTMFYAAITPLLPEYADRFDLTKTSAGILTASYAAGTLLGSIPAGLLAARAGVKPTLLLGLGLMGGASIAFAFAPSVAVLDAARFVQGLGGAASWAAALAWIVAAAPASRRAEMIGTALGAGIFGALLGPVLGTLADALGPEAVFSAVAVIGAGLAAWAAVTPAPARVQADGRLADALRDRAVLGGMWLMALPALLFGTLGVLAPLRLDDLGASGVAIGAVFLIGAGIEALLNPFVGRMADRHGRRLPALIALTASAAVTLLLPIPDRAWVLGVVVVAGAVSFGALWTPAMALISDGAERSGLDQGLAFGLVNLAWALGQVTGSAAGGALADAAGDTVPFLGLSVLCALTLAALGAARARRVVRA